MNIVSRISRYFQTIEPERTIAVIAYDSLHDHDHTPHQQESGSTRDLILACTPGSFQPVASPPELDIIQLTQYSSLTAIAEGLDTNALGFDPTAPAATETEAETFRSTLITNAAFTARIGSLPVAAGMFNPPSHGVSEIAGITTLPPYRERGIASALTSKIAEVAFSSGVEIAILGTDNPVAYRIYTRLGFTPVVWLIRRSAG